MVPPGASAAPPSRSGQDAAAPGSGGARPGLGPEAPTPTCARILRMTARSCRMAIRRSRPPQWGHARTSMANARCIRAAQVQARGVGFTPASCGPAARGAAEAVGSGRTRPYATTRSRHRACGASTPWQMSRVVSGRGVIAANRSRNSRGSNTSSRVPSCHALFSSSATRPSPSRVQETGSGTRCASWKIDAAGVRKLSDGWCRHRPTPAASAREKRDSLGTIRQGSAGFPGRTALSIQRSRVQFPSSPPFNQVVRRGRLRSPPSLCPPRRPPASRHPRGAPRRRWRSAGRCSRSDGPPSPWLWTAGRPRARGSGRRCGGSRADTAR